MSDEEYEEVEDGGEDAEADGGLGFDLSSLADEAFAEATGDETGDGGGDGDGDGGGDGDGDGEDYEYVYEDDDPAADAEAFGLPDFDGGGEGGAADDEQTADLQMLQDVNLKVSVELGRTRMHVEDVLKLTPEAVVELDKAAGDPVDVFVNGRHVARGEVLVLNENFCVRINEVINRSDLDG